MAENMIKFLRGSVANLPQTATAGAVYFTKDEGLYLGLEDGTYHRYGDFIIVADVASLPAAGAHETCMYYCESENILAKWSGTEWTQINKQKTLAELGGVAKSVYDAKIALLEKADTDNATAIAELDAYVGDIPTGYTETNVVAYINKKAEETLAAAQGGSSETAASVKQQLDNYKSENDTRVENAEKAIDAIEADYLKAADKTELAEDIATAQATADGKTTMAEVEAKNYATKTEAQGYADAKDEAIAAAQKAGDDAQDAVDALAGKVGEVPADKTVVGMIADAQAAATYDDTQVKADIKANSDAIDAIEADYLKGADKTELATAISDEETRAKGVESGLNTRVKAIEDDYLKATDKEALQTQINTIMNNPDTEGVINSINEFTQYIADHGQIAEGFRTDINKNKEDIAANAKAIEDKATSDASTYETKTDAASKLTEAKTYADGLNTAMDTRVKVLEGIDHDAYKAADETTLGSAKAYTDEKDSAMNTRVAALEAIDHEHANKAELDLIASGDKAKWDAAAVIAHEHSNKTVLDGISAEKVAAWDAAEGNAKTYADGLNTAMNTRVEALEAIDHDKILSDAKSYADGLANNYDASGSAAQALADAKAYADTAESDAVTTANAYTDSALTWGSF